MMEWFAIGIANNLDIDDPLFYILQQYKAVRQAGGKTSELILYSTLRAIAFLGEDPAWAIVLPTHF